MMITGATGGLGKAFAAECAMRGWNLLLTDIQPTPLTHLAQGLGNLYGIDVLTHACDLSSPEARDQMWAQIDQLGIRLRGLINVAGLDYEGMFLERDTQQIRTILRVNVESTLETTHHALHLREKGGTFHVINVSSLAAYQPMPVKAVYAASKRLLLDFSLAMHHELRPHGVVVTALCPAGMPTTPACVEGIRAQGWLGRLTTVNTGDVAAQTLNATLAGRAVVIPGVFNRLLQLASGLLPPYLVSYLVGQRWQKAREQRRDPALIQLPDVKISVKLAKIEPMS
jgi:hypothetical protein